MSTFVTLGFLLQVLRISVPYVLAALGGTLSERAGVINLALEGMLLGGAFLATIGADVGGISLGLVAGMAGGLLVASLYALAVLRLQADQIVAGVAVNLLVLGLTRFLMKLFFHSASSSPAVPGFANTTEVVAFLAVVALGAIGVHILITRTPYGLRLRAVGEHPACADSLGVSVSLVRTSAVLGSGVLAGLGGAWLALDNHGFVDRMSGGRGYIAIAAVIFGKWRPLPVMAACLMFGLADAAQLRLQTSVDWLPREVVQILPYALTIVALAGAIGRSRAPAALGTPFAGR